MKFVLDKKFRPDEGYDQTILKRSQETLSFVTIWINLGGGVLAKVSQAQKTSTALSHSHVDSKIVELTESENRMVVTRCWDKRSNWGDVGQRI